MRIQFLVVVVFLLIASIAWTEEPQTFRSPMDKVNYAIGVEVIRNFKNQGMEIDLEMVIKGMKDGLSGHTDIPEKELRRILTSFQTELRQRTSRNRTELPSNK